MARILIAEDDNLQGAILRTALENRGYEVEIVGDGLEAVRRLRTGRYDLALLDYSMPGVDGLAAARLLQDVLHQEDRPRLIAVTAAADGLREKEAASGGRSFDAVVSKRQGLPVLLAAIDLNLSSAAELTAAAAVQRGRDVLREATCVASAVRRQRRLAPLTALPALVMAGAFMAAFGWAVTSLPYVEAAPYNLGPVLVVLAMGILYGLWNSRMSVQRRLREAGPTLTSRAAETWHRPLPPPLAAARASGNLLLQRRVIVGRRSRRDAASGTVENGILRSDRSLAGARDKIASTRAFMAGWNARLPHAAMTDAGR